MKKKIILAVTVIACMVCSIGATSCTYAEDTNLEYSYSIDNSKTISLKGSTAQSNSANVDVKNSTITIKSAGTYRITGTLNNGQIIVNAGKDDTVTLILDNANINCSTSAPIYSKQSGTTVVYLADKSTNTLTDTATKLQKTLYSFGVSAKVENVSVGPAISTCGILAIFAITADPATSFPSATLSFESLFLNASLSITSRSPTISFCLFGTSIPTACFPGIGASILIVSAAKLSAISSAKFAILLTLTPSAGFSSYLVIAGPTVTFSTFADTPKLYSVF